MLENNLTEIKHRIAASASRANRSPEDIKLVAVSKRIPAEKIIKAIDSGHLVFGENYVQEALEKIPYIKTPVRHETVFHFIGKLQSNKAKKAAELFDVIETVDSINLGLALEKHSANLNKSLEAYIQVNVSREKQKSGVQPEDCEKILRELSHCQFLRITGLMTMPPYSPDPEDVRPFFRQLRNLSDDLTAKGLLGRHGPVELSMGMSGDFEVAIEEGATVVRIGTAIFGARDQKLCNNSL
jgi:pyridoxal phosphate enzyme (YggS family)